MRAHYTQQLPSGRGLRVDIIVAGQVGARTEEDDRCVAGTAGKPRAAYTLLVSAANHTATIPRQPETELKMVLESFDVIMNGRSTI